MSDAPDTSRSIGLVGGNALPGGVMMRTARRVGVAVRQEATGLIVTEGFDLHPPTGRWIKLPLARGIVAMRTALGTGKEAMLIGDRLRWAAPASDAAGDVDVPEDEPLSWWAKVLMVVGAVIGILVQVLAFRVAPIVIAKQAGLTGVAFIVADAAIRLGLLLGVLLLMSMLRPFRRILSYHGAEHQAIAAYEAGAPLTAAAAAGFTRFHPRCGTSFLVVSAVVSIGVYGVVLWATGNFSYVALIATRIILAPVVTAIAFEIQRQAARLSDGRWRFLSAPGMWAQHLTTRPPGAEELEVAVAALHEALRAPSAPTTHQDILAVAGSELPSTAG
jgi:uncharacterized protein YqhQ